MSRQDDHANTFRRLHIAGDPLVLYNVWSAGSARAVAEAGAPAIATSSWAVAADNGEGDGERLPTSAVFELVRRIVGAVDLPVSVDFEAGYADSTDGLAASITRLIETGAVGCNLEDGIPGTDRMRPADEQAARLQAARAAAQRAAVELFINARTDVFLLTPPGRHAEGVAEALGRARIYAESGADSLFVPGVVDLKLIADLVKGSPLPLNVMISEGSPDLRALAEAGVARVSHGPGPYLMAMGALRDGVRNSGVRGSA